MLLRVIHEGAHRLSSKCCNSYWLTGCITDEDRAQVENNRQYKEDSYRDAPDAGVGHRNGAIKEIPA